MFKWNGDKENGLKPKFINTQPKTILSVHLKPSRQLVLALSFAHLAAAGLLWLMTLPISIKLPGTIALVISLCLYLRHFALLSAPRSIVAFDLSETLQCTVTTKDGEQLNCTISGSSFVSPYLLVLDLKPLNKFFSRSLVILNDGINAEEFRQLRVLLRWRWRALN